MFKVPNVTIEALGERLTIKPMSVTRMLETKSQYDALKDDDLHGIVQLMKGIISQVCVDPVVSPADLEDLDFNALKDLFEKVSGACGLIPEKNAVPDKTA